MVEIAAPIMPHVEINKKFKVNPIRIDNIKDKTRGNFLHPCPFNLNLVLRILERQKPTSVIDPFMGSGAVGYAARQLGIKWIGYEIEKKYEGDVKWRMQQRSITI